MITKNANRKEIAKDVLTYIMLIVFAISISLQSSLFQINKTRYISTDVAVWINIAKKMLNGEIMYKDFFDHKGPVLYFLYYIGYLLNAVNLTIENSINN